MRVVVVLATLSRKINHAIFQPNYLTPDSNDLRETFNQLAKTDGDREAHCRSVMLAVDPARQRENLKSRGHSVLKEVSAGLFPLLSPSQFGEFEEKLRKVISSAAKVWRDIQCSPMKFEAEFDPAEGGWRPFNFPGSEEDVDDRFLGSHSLTVYPQLTQLRGGKETCLEYVIRLPQSHKLCQLAEQEIVQNPSSPTINCPSAKRTRRPSVSIHGAQTNGKRTPDGTVNGSR